MKYIRTKDGNILSKGKIICSAFNEEYCSPNWNEDIEKYLQTKIVAEADTIEKLCDYWDFYNCLNEEYEIKSTFLTPHILYLDLQKGYIKDVKLCIRTDKGLIYVAKMNDKGELELL